MKNPKLIETVVVTATYKLPTYKITNEGIEDGDGLTLKICKGDKSNEETFRQEGVFVESLLQTVVEHLVSVNIGALANRDTSLAITYIEDALLRLGKRAEDRKIREVQGTYNK